MSCPARYGVEKGQAPTVNTNGARAGGLGFGREQRLRLSQHFSQVYERGRKISSPHLILFFRRNRLGLNRLGLVVSKKAFKASAKRHLMRRRLREAYRQNKLLFLPGHDIVVVYRRTTHAQDCTGFNQTRQELLGLAQKAGLLTRPNYA